MSEITQPVIIKFRRGTKNENDMYLGPAGEITVDLTTPNLRIHDGVTAGGHATPLVGSTSGTVPELVDVSSVASLPAVGGKLLTGLVTDTDTTITVGQGGDYVTLWEAFKYFTQFPVVHKTPAVVARIQVLSGYTIEEQNVISGIDLSPVEIIADEAAVPVNGTTITAAVEGVYPILCTINGGKAPRVSMKLGVSSGSLVTGFAAIGAGSSINVASGYGCSSAGFGAQAISFGEINLRNAAMQQGGTPNSVDIVVSTGGRINASGAVGGTSQDKNVFTGDGYILDSTVATPTPSGGAGVDFVNSSFTVTVGSGGDFLTPDAAFAYVSRYFMPHHPNASRPSVNVEVMSGYVWNTQLVVNAVDLSFATLTSQAASVEMDTSSYVNMEGLTKPAIAITNGGKSPNIRTLFVNTASFVGGVTGLGVSKAGSVGYVSSGYGFQRFQHGCHAIHGAEVYCERGKFDYNQYGIRSGHGAKVYGRTLSATSCSYAGALAELSGELHADSILVRFSSIGIICASNGSRAYVSNAVATMCTTTGLSAQFGGVLHGNYANVSSCTVGLHASVGGELHAYQGWAGNCSSYGGLCESGSRMHVDRADLEMVYGTPNSNDLVVRNGSYISANSYHGGTSQVVNSWTANGVIFNSP